MFLPLYKNENDDTPKNKPADANTGLWFERFFDQFENDASGILKRKPPNGEPTQGTNFWLQKFKKEGNTVALRSAACRQMDLVKQLNGEYKFFNTQWHFVTGMGYPHPVENGLSWHPVHGVPYLSGAAVKGLVRAWVEEWAEFDTEEKRKQRLLSWFGSESKQSTSNQAGDIIFFDALPVKEVQLVTDIMTPHYGDWYSKGGKIETTTKEPEKIIPADWHDPIPIPFLVVDKATSYLFSVAPRHAQVTKATMKAVIECLIQALEWLGAGAKTATGYGQMPFDQKIHDAIEKELQQVQIKRAEELQKAQENRNFEDEIKNLSLLAQEYFTQIKQEDWQNNKNAFWQSGRVEHWLDQLESEPEPAIIDSIKGLMNQHFAGLLANPEKVQGRRNEPVYKERQQQIAHRVNKL